MPNETSENLRDALDRYEEMAPQGCVAELIGSLDHLAEHDAVAAELADKVRALFRYSERYVSDPLRIGDVIVPHSRLVQSVAVLDDLEARVKSDIASKALDEEERAATRTVRS
jgi:hypothetical protein